MPVLVPATRDENYAHAQPSLTAKKLRKLELIAGARRFDRSAAGVWSANRAVREAEKRLATLSGGVLRADGPRLAGHSTEESGRERDTGARIN